MFKHRLGQNPSQLIFVHWFLLAFNAGYINAGGFLAAGRFVTHVTGFATLFGVDLANGKFAEAIGILSVPVFFLLGATIAGLLIDRMIYFGKKPHYDYVMLLSSACLGLCALIGALEGFGTFGQGLHLRENYLLLALLCLASGLQNAAITSSSGSSVRTTHLSGITTDLGLGIARMLTVRRESSRATRENKANWLRAGTILSYTGGSAVGALLFIQFKHAGFLLPTAIALYSAAHGRKLKAARSRFRVVSETVLKRGA